MIAPHSTNNAIILAKLLIMESSSLDHLSALKFLFNENPSLLGEGFSRKVENGLVKRRVQAWVLGKARKQGPHTGGVERTLHLWAVEGGDGLLRQLLHSL